MNWSSIHSDADAPPIFCSHEAGYLLITICLASLVSHRSRMGSQMAEFSLRERVKISRSKGTQSRAAALLQI